MDKKNMDTYYDFEIGLDDFMLRSGGFEDFFYLKDIKQRKILIPT